MTDTTTPPKPLRTLRIGAVQAAIWRNDGEKGPFYNVTFERRYRDSQEQWQSSHSFGRDDLLILAKIADEAHTIVCNQQSKDRDEQRQASEHQWGASSTQADSTGEETGHGDAETPSNGDPASATATARATRRRSR